MSANITASFTTQWDAEVKHSFAQYQSKLRDTVRVVNNVEGATYPFHKMGTVTAVAKTRDANLTWTSPAQSTVSATLTDMYAPIRVDNLDLLKTNIDTRAEYQIESIRAINEVVDKSIITAWGASNTDITTLTGGLTQAKLLEALEKFISNSIPPEDRFLVVGGRQIIDALGLTSITSADYQNIKALVEGSINSALGFKWVVSNYLTKDALNATGGAQANTRHCYAVAKSATGLALAQDLRTNIEWSTDAQAWNIVSSISHGVAVIDNVGVIEIGCVE